MRALLRKPAIARALTASLILLFALAAGSAAQEPNPAQLIAKIDAAVKFRVDNIASYTVTERYSVYRGSDRTHTAAEMTVRTTYKRDSGKSYEVLSESGSSVLRRMVLHSVLDNEREVNRPGIREHAWFVSNNYQMQLKPGAPQQIDGRACYALDIAPKPGSQNLVQGTLWADAHTGNIVQVEGNVKKGLSLVTGAVKVFRKYSDVDGFAQATFATAESDSPLFGRTTVTIEYRDYHIVRGNTP
jgi:outer membrane lipoprotein-sorting protein